MRFHEVASSEANQRSQSANLVRQAILPGNLALQGAVQAAGRAESLMVGRTPWSARDALVPPVGEESVGCHHREADQGVDRGRGRSPHYLCNCPETGKVCGIKAVRSLTDPIDPRVRILAASGLSVRRAGRKPAYSHDSVCRGVSMHR